MSEVVRREELMPAGVIAGHDRSWSLHDGYHGPEISSQNSNLHTFPPQALNEQPSEVASFPADNQIADRLSDWLDSVANPYSVAGTVKGNPIVISDASGSETSESEASDAELEISLRDDRIVRGLFPRDGNRVMGTGAHFAAGHAGYSTVGGMPHVGVDRIGNDAYFVANYLDNGWGFDGMSRGGHHATGDNSCSVANDIAKWNHESMALKTHRGTGGYGNIASGGPSNWADGSMNHGTGITHHGTTGDTYFSSGVSGDTTANKVYHGAHYPAGGDVYSANGHGGSWAQNSMVHSNHPGTGGDAYFAFDDPKNWASRSMAYGKHNGSGGDARFAFHDTSNRSGRGLLHHAQHKNTRTEFTTNGAVDNHFAEQVNEVMNICRQSFDDTGIKGTNFAARTHRGNQQTMGTALRIDAYDDNERKINFAGHGLSFRDIENKTFAHRDGKGHYAQVSAAHTRTSTKQSLHDSLTGPACYDRIISMARDHWVNNSMLKQTRWCHGNMTALIQLKSFVNYHLAELQSNRFQAPFWPYPLKYWWNGLELMCQTADNETKEHTVTP